MNKMLKDLKRGYMSAAVLSLLQDKKSITVTDLKSSLNEMTPDFSWRMPEIKGYMEERTASGELTLKKNGSYKMSVKKATPAPKLMSKKGMKSISKSKAMNLMLNSHGNFFTVEFIKKDGSPRVMNCLCKKDQDTSLGYIEVKEAALLRKDPKNAIRRVNMQTLTMVKVGGVSYKVK